MKHTYLSISFGEHILALPLLEVQKVARMVSITPVGEGAPRGMLGVVSLGGRVVPVFDPRSRLGLAPKTMDSSDQLVFVSAGDRLIALWVDEAGDVFRAVIPEDSEAQAAAPEPRIAPGESVWKELRGVAGVTALEDGLVVIQDLDAFLSQEDVRQLDATLEAVDMEDARHGLDNEVSR